MFARSTFSRLAPAASRTFSSGQQKAAPGMSLKLAAAGFGGVALGAILSSSVEAGTTIEVASGGTTVKVALDGAGGDGGGSSERFQKTLDDYPRWFRQSVSRKMLTPELYLKFANIVGPRGFTFDEAIQCGIDSQSGTGCAIPDEESYHLWREWYDIMIEERHGHPPGKDHPSDLDYSKIDISGLPPDLDSYCVSTRIRAARNISGFALPPAASRGERRAVEAICKEGLETLTGELGGKYYSLADMTQAEEDQLQADHFLFQKPNAKAMISACGGCRDWPDARGIYHNKEKTFLVWVNEEDQMRVISMQKGGNVFEVFKRWVDGVNGVDKVVSGKGYTWMTDPHAGMLSSCVSNLGTGLRASMHIKLPNLMKACSPHGAIDLEGQEVLENYAATMALQIRGTGGEHTAAGADGKVDLSNNERIGKSEVQLVQTMIDGVNKFIELDKKAKYNPAAVKAEVMAALGK